MGTAGPTKAGENHHMQTDSNNQKKQQQQHHHHYHPFVFALSYSVYVVPVAPSAMTWHAAVVY